MPDSFDPLYPLSLPDPVVAMIAVVEDNEDSRDVFQLMLEVLGLEVVVANSVDSALKLPWDKISHALIDWMLPTHDGTELIYWMQRNHPHVRMALCTAAHNTEDIPPVDCEILLKPIIIEDLRQWLTKND